MLGNKTGILYNVHAHAMTSERSRQYDKTRRAARNDTTRPAVRLATTRHDQSHYDRNKRQHRYIGIASDYCSLFWDARNALW